MRKALGLVVLVGAPLYLQRRRDARRERVHLYFDDGSTVVLADGAVAADRLLAVARRAL
jgi:hypothetical protein